MNYVYLQYIIQANIFIRDLITQLLKYLRTQIVSNFRRPKMNTKTYNTNSKHHIHVYTTIIVHLHIKGIPLDCTQCRKTILGLPHPPDTADLSNFIRHAPCLRPFCAKPKSFLIPPLWRLYLLPPMACLVLWLVGLSVSSLRPSAGRSPLLCVLRSNVGNAFFIRCLHFDLNFWCFQ